MCLFGEQEVAGSNPVAHCRDDPPPALSLPSPNRWEVGRASQRSDFSRFEFRPAGRLEVRRENIDAHLMSERYNAVLRAYRTRVAMVV